MKDNHLYKEKSHKTKTNRLKLVKQSEFRIVEVVNGIVNRSESMS